LTFTDAGGTTDLDNVTNIEIITLGAAATSVTTVNNLVTADATLKVNGALATAGITWNGAAETNGFFSITGGTGADVLTGGAMADTIIGGDGADTITGGLGVDSMTGGAGVDKYVFVATDESLTDTDYTDVITNFISGSDKLVLGAVGTVTTAQVDKIALAGTYHAGDVITISGVATGSVSVTASTDLDTTGAALAAAINAASGKTVTAAYVSASDWLTLTADAAGTAFTATAAVANTATTTVAVTETVHESAESSSGAADGTQATDTITLGGTFHAGDVITLTGYGSTVAVTAVTDAATTLAALVTAINGASATGTATLNSSTITWVQTGSAGGAHTGAGTVANAATITATDSTTTANASGNYVENLTAVTSLDNLLTAADAALNGTVDFYFGVYAGNGYLVQDGDGTNHTNLIKLSGVTDIDYTDIIASA
jgi:hypothetical protein